MKWLMALILVLACFKNVSAETIRAPLFNSREPWAKYVRDLLEEALERTNQGKKDEIIWVDSFMTQDRALESVRRGETLDLYWTMTSQTRERGLRVIRIPLLRGLLGTRLIVIKKGDQEKFDKIQNLDDLKKVSFGQGHDWPDTQVLKNAGLEVQTSPAYDNLYVMMNQKRFDKEWGVYVKKHNLKKRLIFKFENPFNSQETIDELKKHPEYLL